MRNPDEIVLNGLSKKFEYESMSREIDGCENIEEIRLAAKCYLKLYLATLEAFGDLKIASEI